MKSGDILSNIDNPRQLERLYRDDKRTFTREFNLVYPAIREHASAQVWHERLNFENQEISWGSNQELIFVVVTAFIAGLVAKIPDLTNIKPEFFYPRNLGLIVFPFLAAYFAWKQKLQTNKIIIAAVAIAASAIYINLLPDNSKSDTLILACIHLPLFLWTILGFTFTGEQLNNYNKRLDFLRYNGDLVVMTTIILIAGALLTALTFALFELIGLKIEDFYMHYVGIWGLAAAPMAGTYLVQANPHLVNKVSPVIARVFTPLVLVTLLIYLVAVIYTGKDPYNDREFLFVFNVLLIGVMALILFSVAETNKNGNNKPATILLFSLAVITVIVNGIALSAIVFRISEWGITPNRLAILGGNLLILTNLLIVTCRLFKSTQNSNEIDNVEKSIASYLPLYGIWAFVVVFVFPLVFNFK
jgi:hypothetical protein